MHKAPSLQAIAASRRSLEAKIGGHRPVATEGFGQPTTLSHHTQRVTERQRAGDTRCDIFTEAMSQHRHRLDPPGPPQCRERIFDREQRRLGVVGAIDRGGLLWTPERVQQPNLQIRRQAVRTFVQRTPKGRRRFVKLRAPFQRTGRPAR